MARISRGSKSNTGKHYAKTKSRSSKSTSSRTPAKHAASSRSSKSAQARSTSSRTNSTRSKAAAARKSTPRRTTARKTASRRRTAARQPRSRARRIITIILIISAFIVLAELARINSAIHAERISSEGFTHADKYANYLIVDGIDVSYAQSTIRDWRKIKRSGVDFVIIRGGYRASESGTLHEDDFFKSNIKGAKKAGLMVGVYIFSQAKNTREAKKEADFLIKLVRKYDVDLPLVLDYETVPGGRLDKALSSGKLDSDKLNKIARAFTKEVEAAGYESMVYANLSFLNHRFNGSKLSDFTNVWVAQFNSSTNYDNAYRIWQCSDNSKVPGITGVVDKDFMYINPDKVIKTRGARNKGAKSLGDCQVEITKHSNTYLGSNVEPGASVYDGRKALKEGRDYRVSYVHNTSAGTGYAIVTGLGDYKDQVTMSFMIKGI